MEIIKQALQGGRNILSEHESKEILKAYSVPVPKGFLVSDEKGLKRALMDLEYPVAIKGCSPDITHKTEHGLVFTGVRDEKEALHAFHNIRSRLSPHVEMPHALVEEMVEGKRELMVGLIRDPKFGPCVMFGLGGIFTEILKDLSFRLAPLTTQDAMNMMKEIRGSKILDSTRGMPAVNLDELSDIIVNVGRIGVENEEIMEIDINPVIISGSSPVAADALVILTGQV